MTPTGHYKTMFAEQLTRTFEELVAFHVDSCEMKYDEEVNYVGAVEGGHVENEDDLQSLDVGHSQNVGQGTDHAPQHGEGRAEN